MKLFPIMCPVLNWRVNVPPIELLVKSDQKKEPDSAHGCEGKKGTEGELRLVCAL